MNRWSSAIGTAVQLGATYYVNRFIEPKLKGLFDWLPVVGPPLITLVLSGLIVVFLTDLTVARPRLVFRWSEAYERTAFQPIIELRPDHPKTVDVQVELMGNSLLTRLVRRSFRKPGVTARVSLVSSDAVRLRAETRSSRAVTVDDDGQTVSIPFPAVGTTWVTLTAEVTDAAPTNPLNVEVEHAIDTGGGRSTLARLVVREHNVTTLRAIRTA